MSDNPHNFGLHPRVFVSYAHSDGADIAASLRERIEKEHPDITFWQDRSKMQAGIGWWKQITDALEKVEILLMVITPAAFQSEVAVKEWRYARQQGVRVCPVLGISAAELDFNLLPSWMRKTHFYDPAHEWDTLINFLKSPGKDNRVPFMAPDLPHHYVERQDEFETVLSYLLDESHNNPQFSTTALQGPGGFGKTTLACSLCHSEQIINAYDDGILWVSLGEQPDIQGALTKLYAALTGERLPFIDIDDASIQVSSRLDQKNCLLVIDDVWHANHLKPFLRGGHQCSRLVTTRQLSVLTDTTSSRIIVDKMTDDQAVKMLSSRVEYMPENLPKLRSLARRFGEWPLLLKLAASHLWERVERGDSLDGAVSYLNRAMDKRGVTAFDRTNPDNRHDTVASTVSVSLELFAEADQRRCAELAIFPRDTFIPLESVANLWGLDEFDTEELIQRLDGAALLDFDLKTGGIRIHRVLQSYLKSLLTETATIHARLVDQWWQAPRLLPNHYAWKWIGWHLQQADDNQKLLELLLDFDWLKARLENVEIQTILKDFERLKNSDETRMVRDALQLASYALSNDPGQIYIQLMGRLDRGRSLIVDELLDQADANRPVPGLLLADASLTHPGGALTGIMKGHIGSVEALAILADGRRAVSGSEDYTLRLWDLENNRVIRTYEGHQGVVYAVTITPDEMRILSASDDRTIRLWDLESGRLLLVLSGHTLAVQGVAVATDGKYAASVSEDGTVRRWNLNTGQSERLFKGLYHQLNSVAITPDNRCLAFGVGDWSIMLLNLTDNQESKRLEGHTGVVRTLAIAPDGDLLVSGADDHTLRVWSIATGVCLGSLQGHTGSVETVAFTADGKNVISGSRDRTLRVWRLETFETLRILEGHSGYVKSLAIAAASGRTISGSTDRSIRHWDIETATLRQTRQAHLEAVSHLSISPNGDYAISSSQDNDLVVWRMQSNSTTIDQTAEPGCDIVPDRIGSLSGQGGWIRVLRITPDGSRAVTGSADHTLRIWNLSELSPSHVLKGHTRDIRGLALSADGSRGVSISRDKTIRVWDLASGRWIRALVSKDNKRALSALKVGDALLEELLDELEVTPTVDIIDKPINHNAQIVISRDGSQVVFCANGIVCVWDVNTGHTMLKEIGDFECTLMTYDADERRVILGSLFGSCIVCALDESSKLVRNEPCKGAILDIAVTPDGEYAITAGRDDTIKVWELDSGRERMCFNGNVGKVDTVAISPNGDYAYSVYHDTLMAYDLNRSSFIAAMTLDHQITAIGVTPNGKYIAVGDQSGYVHFLCLATH
ncbi:MAG: NB-ARC domain-containing protein [Candidatus Thiodiazotropha sp.]